MVAGRESQISYLKSLVTAKLIWQKKKTLTVAYVLTSRAVVVCVREINGCYNTINEQPRLNAEVNAEDVIYDKQRSKVTREKEKLRRSRFAFCYRY